MTHAIRAVVSETRERAGCALLVEGETLLLKAYASPDGRKLRIVLPELRNYAQTRIDPDHRLLEFTRDAAAARREVSR